MKTWIAFFLIAMPSFALAQDESVGSGPFGLRLGVGANLHSFEQSINGGTTQVDTDAQEYSFVHLSFNTLINSRVMASLYGQVSTVSFDRDPSIVVEDDQVTLYDVNLEGRALVDGTWDERVSWRPVILFGINAQAMPVIKIPDNVGGLLSYERMDLFSVQAGLGTTAYLGDNVVRVSVRAGSPFATNSDFKKLSAYMVLGQISYVYDMGSAGSLGLDGLVRYVEADFEQLNPANGFRLDNELKIFTTGAKIFYSLPF